MTNETKRINLTPKFIFYISAGLIIAFIIVISVAYSIGKSHNANSTQLLSQTSIDDGKFTQSFKIDKYEKAEFNKFNSPAEENGLGNTLVYLDGSFSEIETADNTSYSIFTDSENNKWLLTFGFDTIDIQNSMANKKLRIFSAYMGFSEVYQMPALYLIRATDYESGFPYNYYDFLDMPAERTYMSASEKSEND